MNTESSTQEKKISTLIDQLCDDDGLVRTKAREELIEIGGRDVIQALMVELNDASRRVRWEAIKALASIGDPIAAPALVHHLGDEDCDIRWLAAEGLSVLGTTGLLATLNASIQCADNADFCDAAHHAFNEFKKHWPDGDFLDPVIEACRNFEPGVGLPVAAFTALQELKVKTKD